MKLRTKGIRSCVFASSLLAVSCSGQFNNSTPPASPPAPSAPSESVEKLYEGSLNDRIAIEMKLRIDGDTMSGTYIYTKYGRDIPIKGTIDGQRRFVIREYGSKDGSQTGTFAGNFVSDSELKGIWSNPAGDKVMGFLLREKRPNVAGPGHRGEITTMARPNSPSMRPPAAEEQPTEAHARSVFENLTRSIPIWGGRPLTLTVLSFRKTDGQARMESGVKQYRVFFEAEVQCPRNDYVNMLDVPINIGIHGSHRQGRERTKGFVVFERTERGWKGQDGTVY